jgi:hypothetical protein
MNATGAIKRPKVRGIAGLNLLTSIVGILYGVLALGIILEANGSGTELNRAAASNAITGLIFFPLGIICFVSAILIFRYKRLGLYLGAVPYGVYILIDAISTLNGRSPNFLSLVVSIAALYYIYKYLNEEPAKSFFT